MHLGHVDVPRGDAGHPVRRGRRASERRPVRVVLVQRRELKAVQRLSGPANPHGTIGQVARAVVCRQHDGRRAVGDGRAHEQSERRRDHARAQHLIDRRALLEVRVRVLRRVRVVLDADERQLLFRGAVGRHVALGRESEAGRRREPERRLPFPIDTGSHVQDGFVARRLVELLDAEHHHDVGESGGDERVRVTNADRSRRAHVLGARAQRGRLDAERLGRERRDVTLERGALRHDGADDESVDVAGPYRRHGIEARFPRFPDQVAIAGLPHAELRDAGADERDVSHHRCSDGCTRRAASRAGADVAGDGSGCDFTHCHSPTAIGTSP